MSAAPPPVIVGAGPAGVRAASVLVAAGLRPIVIDEAPASGGQIYRRAPAGFMRGAAVYGSEAAKATAIHRTFDSLVDRIDYRPQTTVWNLRPGRLYTVRDGVCDELTFGDIVLATGAMDRIVPIPGWTIPGVYALGGAQISLKAQGCVVGARTAFVGTGPLLWLVAYQYLKAGGTVAAVVDTTPFATKARQLFGLLRGGKTFINGLRYVATLRLKGVRITEGAIPVTIVGSTHVTALRWREASGREGSVDCDAVAIGFGLKPESQLADLAGVAMRWNDGQRVWEAARDRDGRTAVEGVYLAGDGSAIAGADAAEIDGALAAYALLADRRVTVPEAAVAELRTRRARLTRFREALDAAFPFPAALAAATADDTLVCRCEAVNAGELRAAARDLDAREVNRAKAFSRVGMGRCQGRVCGPVAVEILAAALGMPTQALGALRAQPPIKPLPMTAAVRLAAE
ncbi:MAG: FAD-dependent oxidoreductase [Alphaproteobacteria bacterium]|nr:FAD-dependent oxidoreductase [Alphaproteobacteria bacterium]